MLLAAAATAILATLGASPARLSFQEPTWVGTFVSGPHIAFDDQARVDAVVVRPKPRWVRPGVRFSFAVISDTHETTACDVAQGPKLAEAVRIINLLDPDLVVGVGDLVAGGGDCTEWGRGYPEHSVTRQLEQLKEDLLEKLEAPFVPIAGNHDLQVSGSRDHGFPLRAWVAFWTEQKEHVLAEARPVIEGRSHRFEYKGIGFSLLGYYGTLGLHPEEQRWVEENVQPADLVFRHVNPFGVSCISRWNCGFAMRGGLNARLETLTELLKERGVTALFSGHTHTFYDGTCDGLRFVNTGALGDRSMEWLRGWHDSPWKLRQAFAWVDVLTNASLRITFFVWDPRRQTFLPFDQRHFPKMVFARRKVSRNVVEGVEATCISNRLSPDRHQAALGQALKMAHATGRHAARRVR